MLKLTYTENGFFLERLTQSLEEWVTTRVLLSLRVGTSISVEPSTASFLLSVDLPVLAELKALQQENSESISVTRCDAEYVEVCLEGTWVTSEQDSDEGIFICAMSDRAESCLEKIWQDSQIGASVLSE
jgi:hypothetical protein